MEDETDLYRIIKLYFTLGLQQSEILAFLLFKHNIQISIRSLKRILQNLNLYRRKNYATVEEAGDFIRNQINLSGQLHGYRWMHLKCIQNGLTITQNSVRNLLKIHDPIGVEIRSRNRLRRRRYSSKGPNFWWHLDCYDKLRPYGICVSGCIDGFSRYILWLKCSCNTSKPEIIAGYYMECVTSLDGCPRILRADLGTENAHVAQLQTFLCHNTEDINYSTSTISPFLYGTSPSNQRIESWWSILRKHTSQYWMNLFQQLKDDGMFSGSFIDKALIQFCFLKLIQDDLNTVADEWNSHRIRPYKNNLSPSGRPLLISSKIPWPEYANSSIVYSSGNDTDEELYDIPAGLIALLSVFYGSISVLAVVGNSLVIWIVLTSRRMQNVTNCFIANLALADIVIGLFAIPFQFQAALLQRWNLPHFMCPFCPFVQVLTVNVSIFTLIAIAIDRYRAILNPFRARLSKLRAKIIIAVIWIASTVLASPVSIALRVEMVVVNDPVNNHTKPFCKNVHLSIEVMRTYRWILVFVQYLVPVFVISFVYARIALKLWGNKAPGNAENTRDAALMKNKKKVIKMLVIVVILFDICWLPWQIYNFLQEVYEEINEYRYINIIYFVCDWLAMSNSCYNPFIYGIYNEKFKREFQLRFPFRGRNWTPSPPADDSADDKNVSMHTRMSSVRSNYDWRHNYSVRQSNTISNNTVSTTPSFYRGIAVRQPSFRNSTPGTNGIQTELYVFPAKSPAKHISANDLDHLDL